MRNRVNNIHFVGIGGSGMSGIAEVLVNLGYQVSGSDIAESAVTDRLSEAGAKVKIGHRAENIQRADVVVVSSSAPLFMAVLMASLMTASLLLVDVMISVLGGMVVEWFQV